MAQATVTVTFLNNTGGGYGSQEVVDQGTTVGEFFLLKMGSNARAENYYIRVNRDGASRNYVLRDGDTVSIIPNKIQGASRISVTFLNNTGGGYGSQVDVEQGTTVGEFFLRQMGNNARAENYYIRVNRDGASRNYVLRDGDTVSIIPNKIQGA